MKRYLIVVTMLTSLTSLPTFAESASNFYAGVEAGYGRIDTKAQETAQYLANLTGSTTTYTSDTEAFMGRIFSGYNINENVSAELGYFRSADLTNRYAQVNGTANETYNGQGADLSIVLRPSVASDLNGLFARVGAHYSEVNGTASVAYNNGTYSLAGSGSSNQSGAGLLLGLGYDIPVDKNVVARVGYTFINSVGGVSGANINFVSIGLKMGF